MQKKVFQIMFFFAKKTSVLKKKLFFYCFFVFVFLKCGININTHQNYR